MEGSLFVSDSNLCDAPRIGIGVRNELVVGAAWLVAPAMAALRMCASGGLMPQAKHGGRGVWAVAVAGSKLDGTGFEKVQMGQIQVIFFAGSTAGLSVRESGEAVALLEGVLNAEILRLCIVDFFGGLGTNVILGDDLRKPAYLEVSEALSKG